MLFPFHCTFPSGLVNRTINTCRHYLPWDHRAAIRLRHREPLRSPVLLSRQCGRWDHRFKLLSPRRWRLLGQRDTIKDLELSLLFSWAKITLPSPGSCETWAFTVIFPAVLSLTPWHAGEGSAVFVGHQDCRLSLSGTPSFSRDSHSSLLLPITWLTMPTFHLCTMSNALDNFIVYLTWNLLHSCCPAN